MTATATTTGLVPIQPAFTDAERLALAGFLAGYRGLTREAYALDLRQFTTRCRNHSLPLFAIRRAGGDWTALAPGGSSAGSPAKLGSARQSAHIRCGTRSSPRHWMQASRCAMCKRPPHMRIRAPRCGMTGLAAAWIGTLPISSRPTSQAPPGNPRPLTSYLAADGHCRQAARPLLFTRATSRR